MDRIEYALKESDKLKTKFEDFNLDQDLLKGIYAYGITKPGLVQTLSIPRILENKDIILQSKLDTGKTITLGVSILQLIDRTSPAFQALILVYRRISAMTIQRVFQYLATYLDVKVEIVIGGVNARDQMKMLRESKYQIVIGTPGRVDDMIRRGCLNVDNLKVFALDQGSELIETGFEDQINSIASRVPQKVQTLMFTEALLPELIRMAELFMNEPVKLIFGQTAWLVGKLQQWYIRIGTDEWKLDALNSIYDKLDVTKCMIYCNSPEKVEELVNKLQDTNRPVYSMIDTLSLDEKTSTFKQFLNFPSRFCCPRKILVTNDRSFIDAGPDISPSGVHLINYDLPMTKDEHIAMTEKIDVCNSMLISLVTPSDESTLNEIQLHYGAKIKEMCLETINLPRWVAHGI